MNLFTSLLANEKDGEEEENKNPEKSFDFFFCFHAKYRTVDPGITSTSNSRRYSPESSQQSS